MPRKITLPQHYFYRHFVGSKSRKIPERTFSIGYGKAIKDISLARIIHDVRFRLWRGSRGEAVFEYCKPRMTKPEAEDDIAFGEETMDVYIV